MSSEPTYPEDEPVGEPGDTPDNETVAAVKASRPKRTRQIVTSAAIGIGSAALVAALLYANRSRKGGKS